jgi:hypothetical protein
VRPDLTAQLARVAERHAAEIAAGRGAVDLSHALREKVPRAGTSLAWQYLFPASGPLHRPGERRAGPASPPRANREEATNACRGEPLLVPGARRNGNARG